MKFFSSSQIREIDRYSIEHEPIASIDLMERAAENLYRKFVQKFPRRDPVCVFAGPGNNGGDALAMARKLLETEHEVSVCLVRQGKLSADCATNLERLTEAFPKSVTEITDTFEVPDLNPGTIIIDGLFGSGLSRPLTGIAAQAVEWINASGCTVVSIDIPSGLQGEENIHSGQNAIVRADLTLSLHFPKLAFMFAENDPFVGHWVVVDIGLHQQAIQETKSNLHYIVQRDISEFLRPRPAFSHKGTYGHALIVSGSNGMSGASVLASMGALRSGAGLVTVHGPGCNRTIVQSAAPEVIFRSDAHADSITEVTETEKYDAIGIGPGIGTHHETVAMLTKLLLDMEKPCVLDADALNIIGRENDLMELIPKNSIITPHPKEFERMLGESSTSYQRMIKAQEAAMRYELIIVLKGAYTLLAMPDASLYFNSSGNPGMATAGTGDVLTGIITGLLAQGYTPQEAALTGVYLHGRAADLALDTQSKESLIASDIISRLGAAFYSLTNAIKPDYPV